MLQTLTAQGATARGRARQQTPRALTGGRPYQIADALKSEHRVLDVDRQHGEAVHTVRDGRGDPGRQRSGLVALYVKPDKMPELERETFTA